MFDLSVAEVGAVNVVTSDNGGLSNDQIAEMATKFRVQKQLRLYCGCKSKKQ